MSKEALRDKKRFEGFRSLTPEERNSLADWKPPITKEEREHLRVLESRSTPVVGWYAHSEEVRGPFGRWFTCSLVPAEYQKHVGFMNDDCEFAAGAMNNLIPLLNALDAADAENAKLKEVVRKLSVFAEINLEAANEISNKRLADGMEWMIKQIGSLGSLKGNL